MRIALVGYGYWGPHYARICNELANVELIAICDIDPKQRAHARLQHPGVPVFSSIYDAKNAEAVIVSTPASTHCHIAWTLLRRGHHVLLEKPMALDVYECELLRDLATQNNLVLGVGHTFLYNEGIRQMKQDIHDSSFGQILYVHSTRTNPGPVRKDVDVLWDLAPHDVSIFNFLLEKQPRMVSAVGTKDVAFITLSYPNVLANIRVSWVDPIKVRNVVAVGAGRKIIHNDLRPRNEPLKEQLLDFLGAIKEKRALVSDGLVGEQVVKALVAAQASMKAGGAPQAIQ